MKLPCLRLAGLGLMVLIGLLASLLPLSSRAAGEGLQPLAAVAPKSSCAALTAFDLVPIGGPGSRVTAAVQTTNRNGQAVCAVEATLAPAITVALQLPLQGWSQRYLQIGCGGLCGSIAGNVGAAEGCVPLASGGMVLGATDMGHQDQDGSFGRDPVKRADFAYRAQHLTSLAAKALIQAFYGQAPRFAYFSGCSDGGREALMEAQRYPDDFNGIIAGAGAINFLAQNAIFHAWQAVANTGSDGKPILLADRLLVLHRAVLAACDQLDGLKDGLIANPLACHFDPATVQCPADAKDRSQCLSAEEVAVVRKFYEGPRDPATGRALIVGGPQYGSELAWAGVYVPRSREDRIFSEMVSLPVLRNMAFESDVPTSFTLQQMRFDLPTFDRLRARHPLLDATNPDLSAFAAQGGKLIIWHGWSDPHISPLNSIAYYTALQKTMGASQADRFARLYVIPGMYHCANGEGPDLIDLLTPMMQWVESDIAPAAITARQASASAASDFGAPRGAGAQDGHRGPRAGGPGGPGGPGPMWPRPAPAPGAQAAALGAAAQASAATVRTRPVYPWPYTAVWDGHGDPSLASSFRQGAPIAFALPDWAGADFFVPYQPAP
ncbi:tannase/feruloyl esterase family alpha/beta hydrolase [uncultured Herbaspirillum sp.]|uniref:tannase/feruloyl esterase family alpha/beta hydrolase n=1 Tax=uncultured Herbaspirillum sp. TaxID=160236 RepID=UPI00263857FF|nr:tannase/feruloyl esterase family alpha/beta hydrolase [uncultured Herbaspirillum sp.]